MGQNWVGWCVKAGLELRPRGWDGIGRVGFIKGSPTPLPPRPSKWGGTGQVTSMGGAYSGPGSRLWDKRAPLMHRPFAGPGPRLWDRGEDPSMQQVGPVNGTELGGLVCEGWIGAEAPNMGCA